VPELVYSPIVRLKENRDFKVMKLF